MNTYCGSQKKPQSYPQEGNKMRNILCVLMAIPLLTGLATTSAFAVDTINSTGEENFQRYCAACHGAGGLGDGPVAAAIFKKVPDLTRIAERRDGKFPRQMIANSIDGRWEIDAHGTRMMPVWGYEFWIDEGAGEFSDMGVAAILEGLVDFLESIQVDALAPVNHQN
jgi:mono/diheme cytochrome c family protein